MATVFSRLAHPRDPVIAPIPALQPAPLRLFLTSFTLLFVELILIRWIPALVTYVGFFSNFVLMASFLGIGLGILLGRRASGLAASPFPFLLLATVTLVTFAQLNIQVRSSGEIFFGLAESHSADTNFVVLPLIVVLVTALMAALALPLGGLLRSMPPLKAYAIDIAGSMAGIAAFAGVSLLQTPPGVWFGIVALLLLLLALGRGPTVWSVVAGLAMVATIAGGFVQRSPGTEVWSPYYRVDVNRLQNGLEHINVNGIPHQAMVPVNFSGGPWYEQVYAWFPGHTFGRVLIVGAGSGTDTAHALAHGATRVDAVEIDPAILAIGKQLNPDRPYSDPRVHTYVNDGRAFLRTSTARYDLVIFALPDSLTLLSNTAHIRLESFLFTVQAFESVRDHLTPNGVFVLYNTYREAWLIAKIGSQLTEAFGSPPLVRTYRATQAAFATGPLVAATGGKPPGDRVDRLPIITSLPPTNATDDWPFLYLRIPFISRFYLAALAFLVLLSAAGIWQVSRRTGPVLPGFSPHFFVLGTAFLVLETKSLVSFSLLFGSTWIVNALAFFAILASVLLAIGITAWVRPRRSWPLYIGLFIALAVAYLVPPEELLLDPPALRYALAAVVAFAPVFFANLVFTYSFRDVRAADMAFASNLLGAMIGGVLEYLALITGYRILVLVVGALYLLAYLLATRWQILADRHLEAASEETPPRVAAEGAS
jgi:SAM-dependent methyltransferase